MIGNTKQNPGHETLKYPKKQKPRENLCACGCGGFTGFTWISGHARIQKYTDEEIFILHEDKYRASITRDRFKRKRMKEGTYRCDKCGISEWRDQKLSLIMDHIDGRSWNDLLENLQLVCPNCASLLPTHCGRNKGKCLSHESTRASPRSRKS